MYGTKCYRKNAKHLASFYHPRQEEEQEEKEQNQEEENEKEEDNEEDKSTNSELNDTEEMDPVWAKEDSENEKESLDLTQEMDPVTFTFGNENNTTTTIFESQEGTQEMEGFAKQTEVCIPTIPALPKNNQMITCCLFLRLWMRRMKSTMMTNRTTIVLPVCLVPAATEGIHSTCVSTTIHLPIRRLAWSD